MGVFEDVEHFFVTVAEGLYHFVVKIAGELYHALLECIDSLVHAVEFVFNKIKVFFEDLIKWLGFIFEWHDILRTHAVLKNILLRYAERAVNKLGQLGPDIDRIFSGLDAKINAWAKMDGPSDTVASYEAHPPAKGQHSPLPLGSAPFQSQPAELHREIVEWEHVAHSLRQTTQWRGQYH